LGVLGQARLKFAPNMLQSETGQSFNQAQRAFIEAVLRKDSGASIPVHEYDSLSKTYFPQPGDSKATLAQKKSSRETQIKSLRAEAGRGIKAYGEEYSPTGPTEPTQKPDAGGPTTVTLTVNGKKTTYNFPSGAAAQAFKKEMGVQ